MYRQPRQDAAGSHDRMPLAIGGPPGVASVTEALALASGSTPAGFIA